ncbi:phage tail length tape measure family protein [Ensifer sp. ENS02]|uniref:phage tail length tape measure family protein n=1 Tax=Ensifer sp. ENS02 TaxID=2769290 RepID=UPI00177E025E|nr:phage tail length tape measure family protein [Ensifer sp. ENS02]MBD9522423.1 phage tail length tape measure family protein [Ensifer sp. ENS02]
MAGETDTKLVLQLSADIKSLQKSLKAANDDVKRTTTGIEKDFANAGKSIDRTSQQISRSIQQSTRNLGFQFSDITTSLLSGASPFTVAAQQASQAGDAITDLAAKGGLLKGLGGALAATLSPANLAVGGAIIAFGTLTSAMQTFFNSTGEEADKAREEIEKQQKAIKEIGERWKGTLPGVKAYTDELLRAAEATQLVADKQKLLGDAAKDTTETFSNFVADIAAVRIDLQNFDFEKYGRVGDELSQAFNDVQEAIKAGKDPSEQIKRLQEAIAKAAGSQVDSAKTLATTFDTDVMPVLNRVLQKFKEIGDAFKDVRNPITDYSIGPGGIGLSGVDQAAAINQRADALNSAAARLIKAEEGFITAAKWDKNHFRVGFGSDTFVDDLGKVQEVTQSTVITLAQANADLSRRIVEFQNTIKGQIGGDIWRSLEENQQAALTSVAYNFGNLPSSIVKAIKAGDRGQVAKAIADLSANPERRKREAALFGGSDFSPGEAARNATPYIDEEARALDDAAAAAAKLLQAQRELSPEQKRLADDAAKVAQAFTGTAQAALSGFISDLRNGVSAGDAFRSMLNRVLDTLIDLTIQALFSRDALGGVITKFITGFGGGMSVGTAHRGLHGGTRDMRSGVSPLLFAGAPRLHSGLQPGEFPAILQKGEAVIPRSTVRRGGAGAGNTYNQNGDVHVDVSTGLVTASNEDARDLGNRINVAVQAVLVQESRPGGLLRQRG